MAQVIPTSNSKLGTNTKTSSGSAYIQVKRTGSGTAIAPYVDSVDLAESAKLDIASSVSSIIALKNSISVLENQINSVISTTDVVASEYLMFKVSLSVSTSAHTVTVTHIAAGNKSKNPTGFVKPTVTALNSGGEAYNNRYSVTEFMGSAHTNYLVDASIGQTFFSPSDLPTASSSDNVIAENQLGVEVYYLVSGQFNFRVVQAMAGGTYIPISNIELIKYGDINLWFTVKGYKN